MGGSVQGKKLHASDINPAQVWSKCRAALSHRSAACLWGVGAEKPGTTDISAPRHTKLSRAGIRARSRPALGATEIVFRQNIPVTDIVRTLIDFAAESGLAAVERAVNEADKRNLITPDTLRLRLADHAGEAGGPAPAPIA